MSIITGAMKQKAVYWAKAGQDKYGKPSYSVGVEILCRWEDLMEEVVTAQNKQLVSNHYAMVSMDTPEGGLLWLGELAKWTGADPPTAQTEDVHRIVKFSKLPNLKNTEFLREVWM